MPTASIEILLSCSKTKMLACRQNYQAECETALNKHISVQLYAAYAYTSLAWHFDRDDVALPGLHEFFKRRSAASREQAQCLMAYQILRGGRLALADVGRPPALASTASADRIVSLDAMLQALEIEKNVNAALLQLHSIVSAAKDAHFVDFIEDQCLERQAKCIKRLSDLASQLAQCGPGLGEFSFDRELLGHTADCI